MRVSRLLCIVLLAVVASVAWFVSSAQAQSGLPDFGGNSGTRAPSTGYPTYNSQPRIFVPTALVDFEIGVQSAFTRFRSLVWQRTRAIDRATPADLPTRRRGSL